MMVFRDLSEAAVAELQHRLVVDRELDGVAHPFVVVWLVGHIGAQHDRSRGDDGFLDQAHAVIKVHGAADRLIVAVDLAGLEGAGDGRARSVRPVVGPVDAVEIGLAAEPGEVLAAPSPKRLADLV